MAVSTLMKTTFQVSALAMTVTLVGCGGGGGNDTLPPTIADSHIGAGTVLTQSILLSAITLFDSTGNVTNTLNASGGVAKIKVSDTTGKGISNVLVTFSSDALSFGTTNRAVLTDDNGIATIAVKPKDTKISGAYAITASVVTQDKTIASTTLNYQISPTIVNLLNLTSDKSSLSDISQTAKLSLKTQDGTTGSPLSGVLPTISASCGNVSAVTTSDNLGIVTATYQPVAECAGKTVNITATSSLVTQSIMINVVAPVVLKDKLVYITTGDVNVYTTDSRPIAPATTPESKKTVEFLLLDNKDFPKSGRVLVSLVAAPSDFSFGDGSVLSRTPIYLNANSNGKIVVTLQAGRQIGAVQLRVKSVDDPTITTSSSNISVINQ